MKVPLDADSLMSIINAGSYLVRLEFEESMTSKQLKEKIEQFMAQDEIKIMRQRRNKSDRELDLRPMIFSLSVIGVQGQIGTIKMMVQTGSAGNVRPQEVIIALSDKFAVIKPPRLINIHRSGLYIKKGDGFFTPFEYK